MNAETSDFLRVYEDVLPQRVRDRYRSPATLLDAWSQFVELCVSGYPYGFDEFINDLAVRDFIESISADARVLENSARAEFYATVQKVDETFRSLLQQGVDIGSADRPWWRRGVLKRAGDEYVQDMEDQFGVQVESI
ncbi:hypothetical protein AB0L25_14625 [Spirillospora sp. NPDC052242]